MKIYLSLGLVFLLTVATFAQEPDEKKDRQGPQSPGFFIPVRSNAEVEVLDGVPTGKGGDTTLNAYISRPKNPPPGLMPAVIYVHGGGWKGGAAKNSGAYFLASHGYFTASIEYRLDGVAKWPAQIEDCKLGIRWLRANAAKYHVDPDRIGIMGHSAGGHLVACLGTMDDPALEGTGGYPGVSSKVQAVIDCDGPIIFVPDLPDKPAYPHADAIVALTGYTYAQKPDLWKAISPVFFVKAGDPPFLLVHGDKDPAVPYNQAIEFQAALTGVGVPVQLITIKGAGHMLVANKGQPAAEPDPETIRNEMVAFLDKYLKK
jgi:acetyl esterase/lipase